MKLVKYLIFGLLLSITACKTETSNHEETEKTEKSSSGVFTLTLEAKFALNDKFQIYYTQKQSL